MNPAILELLRERLGSRCASHPRWLAIDGCGAAGKTTLARKLAVEVDADVVSIDDFTAPGTSTWEHGRFVREVLTPLHAGQPAQYRPWRWDWPQPGAAVEIAPGGLVIVEGVSVLARAAQDIAGGPWWDVAIWVAADEATRRGRIANRDPAQLRRVWDEQWHPSEEAYLAAERPDELADMIIAS